MRAKEVGCRFTVEGGWSILGFSHEAHGNILLHACTDKIKPH